MKDTKATKTTHYIDPTKWYTTTMLAEGAFLFGHKAIDKVQDILDNGHNGIIPLVIRKGAGFRKIQGCDLISFIEQCRKAAAEKI